MAWLSFQKRNMLVGDWKVVFAKSLYYSIKSLYYTKHPQNISLKRWFTVVLLLIVQIGPVLKMLEVFTRFNFSKMTSSKEKRKNMGEFFVKAKQIFEQSTIRSALTVQICGKRKYFILFYFILSTLLISELLLTSA